MISKNSLNVMRPPNLVKGFSLRKEEYFRKLMKIYGNDAYLHLAKVNLPKRLEQYKLS